MKEKLYKAPTAKYEGWEPVNEDNVQVGNYIYAIETVKPYRQASGYVTQVSYGGIWIGRQAIQKGTGNIALYIRK